MTAGPEIPFDLAAEAEVIGCSVGSARGYLIAAEHVGPDDFYRPAHRRLFAACADLGDDDLLYAARRIHLAAGAAGVDEDEVRALVDDRSRLLDVHGEFARRVAAAARRRRAMVALAAAYNAIGEGADTAEAVALLGPVLEEQPWAA